MLLEQRSVARARLDSHGRVGRAANLGAAKKLPAADRLGRDYEYRYFGTYRLLLAGLVMFQHFAANAAPPSFSLAVQGYEVGSVAVLAFFCLSGFVIAEAVDVSYRLKPLAFLTNRVLRVYPHFLAAVALLIVLHWLFLTGGSFRFERGVAPPPWSIFSLHNVLLNFANIAPFLDRYVDYTFLPIAWAVRVEMAFYLVVFFCLFALSVMPASRRPSFGAMAVGALVLLSPAFMLAVGGRLPPVFGFLPYFGFGGGLYFAVQRRHAGVVVVLASVPAMIWQFLSLPRYHPTLGFERAVGAEMTLLGLLIAAMTILAFSAFSGFGAEDRLAGKLTYPIYMYHGCMLIVVASLFPDPGYVTLVVGMLASIALSVVMSRLIDPVVDRYRDKMRGRKLLAAI
jgi:peptidoglycan/LPS O-acetylase OafA/YrhL